MIGLALAVAILAATALAAAASLRLRSPVAFGLAAYLLATAEVVLLTEALSLLGSANAAGYLAGEGLLLAAALAAWLATGRPRPLLPRLGWRAAASAHPLLAGLGALVGLGLLYQAAVALGTPPNEWDALVYHLSRAAEWYQRQAVEFVPNAPTQRQNVFPPNTEMLVLYTFAFLGRDWAAGGIQVLAEFALLAAIYGSARRLGWSRPAALFPALLFATLAQVALDAVVTKNNLTVASYVAAAAYFVLARERRELPLAAVALALALGTKLTAVFALPALVLLAAALLPPRRVTELAAWSVAAFAALGAYGFALNQLETGSLYPTTEEATDERHRPDVTPSGTVSSMARVYYDFLDFSGLHPPTAVRTGIARTGELAFDLLAIPPNPPESTARRFSFEPNAAAAEYRSYFGPLGAFLVVPLSLAFLGAWVLRRAGREVGLLALALPLYVLALALLVRYSPLLGRFMTTPVALVMPLAAWVYARRRLAWATALVGAVSLVLVHALDFAKPVGLLGRPVVWTLERPAALALYDADMGEAIAAIEARVPADGRLGAALDANDWSYPLYGSQLERRIVYLPRAGALAEAERLGLSQVVFGEYEREPLAAPGWRVTPLGASGWELAERTGGSP